MISSGLSVPASEKEVFYWVISYIYVSVCVWGGGVGGVRPIYGSRKKYAIKLRILLDFDCKKPNMAAMH